MAQNQQAAAHQAPAQPQLDFLAALANLNQPFYRIWESNPLTGDLTQDITKWFENFEYLASLVNGINDNIHLVELKKALRDRALTAFQSGNDNQRDTYQHAKAFLQASLVYPHQTAIWRQQFMNRKKEESETVADYLRDLRTLVKRAYVGQGEEAQELVLKERFISGLQADKPHTNHKLWKAAYTHIAQNLGEIVAAVSAVEMTQRMFSLQPSAIVTNASPGDVSGGLSAMLGSGNRGRSGYRGGGRGRGNFGNTAQQPTQPMLQNDQQVNNAGQQPPLRCQYDGILGHSIDICRNLARARRIYAENDRQACSFCGLVSHYLNACRGYAAAKHRLNGPNPVLLTDPQVGTLFYNQNSNGQRGSFPSRGSRGGNSSLSGNNRLSSQNRSGQGPRDRDSQGQNRPTSGTQNVALEEREELAPEDDDYSAEFNAFEPYTEHAFCLAENGPLEPSDEYEYFYGSQVAQALEAAPAGQQPPGNPAPASKAAQSESILEPGGAPVDHQQPGTSSQDAAPLPPRSPPPAIDERLRIDHDDGAGTDEQ